jgi:hypothetical protein
MNPLDRLNDLYIQALSYLLTFLAALEMMKNIGHGSVQKDLRKVGALMIAAEILQASRED